MKNYFQFLKDIYFFSSLTDEEIKKIFNSCYEEKYNTSEVIFNEGSLGTKFFIVLDGELEVWKNYKTTGEQLLRTLQVGETFGEIALIDKLPRSATVVAKTTTILLSINRDDFNKLISENNSIFLSIMQALSKSIRRSTGDLVEELKKKNDYLNELIKQLLFEIEHRKKIEAALRVSEEKYRNIFENAIEGIFQISIDGQFIHVNRSMATMLGYDSTEALVASQINMFTHCFTSFETSQLFCEILQTIGQVVDFETQGLRKDGSMFYASLSARSQKDMNGNILFYEGAFVDITLRKQKEIAEREREHAEEENLYLIELQRKKTEFFSIISHELRTPLTSILGFARLIHKDFYERFMPILTQTPKLTGKANKIVQNLEIIVQEGIRLTRLINDLLDYTKIEAGKIEFCDSVFRVAEVLEQAVELIRGEFSLKPNVDLLVSIKSPDLKVNADPDRLIQVLINLLNNAAKFTEQGCVEVTLENDVTGHYVRISVKDTGSGIPEEHINKIFDTFHQVLKRNSVSEIRKITGKQQGTGLGLFICKQIIDHYHGEIWVESVFGKGSTFIFILPKYIDFQEHIVE
ncbi:MAG: cyclic nucleotide-binding domain-containing protein [Desulfobacterales bacterium]|nr:cyclic nucleotide-binding domain-containing protein [Desulfobacterales bacterium]